MFNDPKLLTEPAARAVVAWDAREGTITVDVSYWNRLMALRGYVRCLDGLMVNGEPTGDK